LWTKFALFLQFASKLDSMPTQRLGEFVLARIGGGFAISHGQPAWPPRDPRR
jgi:hypothetical protein